jgi:plastocyanin
MNRRKLLGTTGALLFSSGCLRLQNQESAEGEPANTPRETSSGNEQTRTETPTETPTKSPTGTPTETPVETATPIEEADATIAVGAGGSLQFEPANTAVSQGDTVEFVFESGGHNVSGHPDAHSDVSLPEDAEPWASYDISGNNINHISLNEAGTTYRHTFEETGQYTYVCVPHAASGMIANIIVR